MASIIRQHSLQLKRKQTKLLLLLLLIICISFVWRRQSTSKISETHLSISISEESNKQRANISCRYNKKWNAIGSPIIDFSIRTWRGDGHWLIYCLRSMETFVPKNFYRTIIITYDEKENSFFRNYLRAFQATLNLTMVPQRDVYIRPGPNQGGYYSTMWSKYHTFQLSDADYFIHIDSDTIFNRPVTLIDFLDSQYRVYVKKVPFAILTPDYHKWQKAAQDLFKEFIPYETMTRFPFVYPRGLYICAIEHIERVHQKSFLDVARTTTYFSDHSALGAYLVAHMSERYIDYGAHADEFIHQSWSWGGFNPEQVTFYECILRLKNRTQCILHKPTNTKTK